MKEVRVKLRGKSYQYEFELGMVAGKRKTCTKSGFKTDDEAYNAGIAAMAEYNTTGEVYKPSDMALIDYIDWWYNSQIEPQKRINTQIKYKNCIDTFIRNEEIANVKLKNLTPLIIDKWINLIAKSDYERGGETRNYSQNTISGTLILLKSALKYAVYPAMYIRENPASYIKVPKVQKKTEEKNIVNKHDFELICEKYPRLAAAFMIGFYTGMRIGEICGLTWDNVDMDNKIIHVNKQLAYSKGNYMFAETKTKTSVRDIYFNNNLYVYLKALKKQQTENRLKYGECYILNVLKDNNIVLPTYMVESNANDITIDFVFSEQSGRFYYSRELLNYNHKISDLIGYKFSFHCLRHTHATMLLEAGVDMKLIQERLGHASIATTADIYSHMTDSMSKSVADKLDSFLQTDCRQKADINNKIELADKMQTN